MAYFKICVSFTYVVQLMTTRLETAININWKLTEGRLVRSLFIKNLIKS